MRETRREGRRRPYRQQMGSFWAEVTTGAKVRGHSAPGRAERQEKDGRVSRGERGEGEVRRWRRQGRSRRALRVPHRFCFTTDCKGWNAWIVRESWCKVSEKLSLVSHSSCIYPKELRNTSTQKPVLEMFIAPLFIVAKICKQPKCPSIGECVNCGTSQ